MQQKPGYDTYRGDDEYINKAARFKLCVKCKNAPRLRQSKFYGSFIVQCPVCSQRTIDYQNARLAIEAWNTKN